MLAASVAQTLVLVCLLIAPLGSTAGAAPEAHCNANGIKETACQHAGGEEEEEASLLMQKQRSKQRKAMEAPVPETKISDDGRTATVRFQHLGKQLHYNLESFSVYEDDAEILEYDDEGKKGVDLGPVRTFESRVDSKWATARLHEDGTLSGLFEYEGDLLEIMPDFAEPSLLSSPGKMAMSHSLRYPDVQRIFMKRGNLTADPFRHTVHVDECREEDPWCRPPNLVDPLSQRKGNWAGTKWYPGCYRGDNKSHRMVLGFLADVRASRKMKRLGTTAQAVMETIVAQATLVYEQQMNIRLKIGSSTVYSSDKGAPNYAKTESCDGRSDVVMSRKLRMLTRSRNKPRAVNHLFTGCGNGWGVVGLAYVGSACTQMYNTGVNSLVRPDSAWVTFAHELGHNLDADHSFEDGQGTTGGIMDYGDGLLDGVYQFNTKYRKDEMCMYLDSIVNFCDGKFVQIG